MEAYSCLQDFGYVFSDLYQVRKTYLKLVCRAENWRKSPADRATMLSAYVPYTRAAR